MEVLKANSSGKGGGKGVGRRRWGREARSLEDVGGGKSRREERAEVRRCCCPLLPQLLAGLSVVGAVARSTGSLNFFYGRQERKLLSLFFCVYCIYLAICLAIPLSSYFSSSFSTEGKGDDICCSW